MVILYSPFLCHFSGSYGQQGARSSHLAPFQTELPSQETPNAEAVRTLFVLKIPIFTNSQDAVFFFFEDGKNSTAVPGSVPCYRYTWYLVHVFSVVFFLYKK